MSAGPRVSLQGTVKRVIFRAEDTGYTIFVLKTGGGEVTVVGHFPDEVVEGLPVEIEGAPVEHPRYGPQIEAQTFRIRHEEMTRTTRVRYLAHALGVTTGLAEKILDHFGDRAFEVLDQNPEALLQVRGISRKKLVRILDSWKEHRAGREAILFLTRHGLALRKAVRAFRTLGPELLTLVKHNPYILTEVEGIGFVEADRIARALGIPLNDPLRQEAACLYVLRELAYGQGHVYAMGWQLRDRLRRLGIPELDRGILDRLHREGRLFLEGDPLRGQGRVALAYLWEAERAAARRLQGLLNASPQGLLKQEHVLQGLKAFEEETGFRLSEEQRRGVLGALTRNVFLLTGYAGTGKTTATRAVIHILREIKRSFLLCAPTGKAAKRMEEATGAPAQTIHRMLGFDGKTWRHNREMPIFVDLVAVDEMSMVDSEVFFRLLDGLSPETLLLLIGDPAQLPSVGPGRVLADLLESRRIPGVILREIFRQEVTSSIVLNANAVRQGRPFEVWEADDFRFVEEEDPERIRALIRALVLEYGPDLQVLSGLKRGPLGTRELNPMIREILNPPDHKPEVAGFRVGDRVIQVRNDYRKEVFNGDIGYVVTVEPEIKTLWVDFGEYRIVAYDAFDAADELQLAYALTVHKFQGSEAPVVFFPVVRSQAIMLHRNWLYTAMTRAREKLIIAGSRSALEMAIRNRRPVRRNTFLRELLRQGEPPAG